MPRYVITPDVAIYLAEHAVTIAKKHEIFAPTLSRSQLLWRLYRAVREGEMTREDADRRLTYIRAIRMRLLGDRVLQQVAWKIADQLGCLDTLDAEYVALTQLQADALVTFDKDFASAVEGVRALWRALLGRHPSKRYRDREKSAAFRMCRR